MTNVPDFQLRGTSEVSSLPEPPRSRRWAAWVLGLLLVAVVGVAVYYATIWRARPMRRESSPCTALRSLPPFCASWV